MEREKQIEEMAGIIHRNCEKNCQSTHCQQGCFNCEATALYNAGYRKERQGEWISVEDRLPDEDGEYLTHNGISYYLLEFNASLGLWNVSTDISTAIRDVTHWMPLPQPPKMKGAE